MTGPWARGDASAVNYGVGLIPQFDGNAATPFVGVRGAMVSSFSDKQVLAQSFILDFLQLLKFNKQCMNLIQDYLLQNLYLL